MEERYGEDDFDWDDEDDDAVGDGGSEPADPDEDDDATYEPAANTLEDLGELLTDPRTSPTRSPSPSPSPPTSSDGHSRPASPAGIQSPWNNPTGLRLATRNPGAIIGRDPSRTYEHYLSLLDPHDVDNLYTPYKSKLDWDFANWAKRQGCGSTAVTELLGIEG